MKCFAADSECDNDCDSTFGATRDTLFGIVEQFGSEQNDEAPADTLCENEERSCSVCSSEAHSDNGVVGWGSFDSGTSCSCSDGSS